MLVWWMIAAYNYLTFCLGIIASPHCRIADDRQMLSRPLFLHPIRDRRAISALLLVCALASGLVISVPRPVVKDRSVPFPCMDCNCSCRNEQSCWSSCGCLTRSQKLAWAATNAVQPPEWFDRLCAVEGDASELVAASCCAVKKTTKTCCSSAKSTDNGCDGESKTCDAGRCETESTVMVIPGIGKRRCGGIDRLYVLLSMVLPTDKQAPTLILSLADRLGPVVSISHQGSDASRLDRPPRRLPA